ncbi:hypothetical protein T439DRAFT_382792 [Meredithblackwellia eburnea MCA 4105]
MGLGSGFGDRLGVQLGVVKSSVFIAKVEVIELAQVPLVHARFRVKWSFKHPTTSSHVEHTLEQADDARRHLAPLNLSRSRSAGGGAGGHTSSGSSSRRSDSPHHHLAATATGYHDSADESSASSARQSREFPTRPLSPPRSPPLGENMRTPNPNRTPTVGSQASFTFSNPFGADSSSTKTTPTSLGAASRHVSASHHHQQSIDEPPSAQVAGSGRRGATVAPSGGSHSAGGSGGGGSTGGGGGGNRAEPKGSTSLISLRSHTATFKREIQCPVAIPLKHLPSSSKYQLQPSPLRLAVRQESPTDAEGSKSEFKTGEVILDLSQFVGSNKTNSTPRRYLLKDCKTNATLRVAVTMEFVGGESGFIAPPLKTGQVSSSSSSIMSTNSVNNKSSTSVNSKRSSTQSGIAMSRTNSSGSISLDSSSTRSLSGKEKRGRGWRPANSAYSSTTSPSLLGANNSAGDNQSAFDIVESLFNRAPRSNSWMQSPEDAMLKKQASTNRGNRVGESETLVFNVHRLNGTLGARPRPQIGRHVSAGPTSSQRPQSLHAPPTASYDYADDRSKSWYKVSPSPTSFTPGGLYSSAPSRPPPPSPANYNTTTTANNASGANSLSSSQSSSPQQRQKLNRRMSSASARSKTLSVRWDDGESPRGGPSQRSSNSSLRNSYIEQGGGASAGEGDDEDDDDGQWETRKTLPEKSNPITAGVAESLEARKGVVGDKSAKIIIERNPDKGRGAKPTVPRPVSGIGKSVKPSDGSAIEWAKSWG